MKEEVELEYSQPEEGLDIDEDLEVLLFELLSGSYVNDEGMQVDIV